MRCLGARHRHRVVRVLQAVVGLVLDRRVGSLLGHARSETATLHHESGDDAVEDGTVVVALLHVAQKVLCRFGRLGCVEFEGDRAVVGDVQFDLGIVHG